LNGVALNGSYSYGYHRNTAQGNNSVTNSFVFYANSGDVFTLKTIRVSGGAILKTMPQGISLVIETI